MPGHDGYLFQGWKCFCDVVFSLGGFVRDNFQRMDCREAENFHAKTLSERNKLFSVIPCAMQHGTPLAALKK